MIQILELGQTDPDTRVSSTGNHSSRMQVPLEVKKSNVPAGTSTLFEESERFSKDVEQKLLGPLGGEEESKVTSTNLLLATSRVFCKKFTGP